jgi:4-amino-4-deoxy-L-arabinose transferase-like glycosyltransferase
MATQKKPKGKKSRKPSQPEVKFFVEPGTKVQITVDVGKKVTRGKVPLTVRLEQVTEEQTETEEISQPTKVENISAPPVSTLLTKLDALKNHLKTYDLATWIFISAVAIYLITRLIGLTRFPIYFFTDEAIQTQSIIDLIKNGYKNPQGIWFPTYFRNGDYYNLSLSVYLQWLPYTLFGKSAFITRATSVLVTLIAAISIGMILRDIFNMKYWWLGTLFLSITPAWFLHSRTAFETAEFVSLYAGTLCSYLLYRCKSPRYLYLTIFLGALSFYAYSPAQFIVPLTALGLLISDWRYHWENRRTTLASLVLLLLLALPYIRYSINNPDAPFVHLHTLFSYWFDKIPLSHKIARYVSEFGIGLSPWYWYIPNDLDLSRHLMKDYGNIMLITLPLALFGLVEALRKYSQPAFRTILIALLISPAATALVQTSITRALVFVIPAAIVTAIGFEQYLHWLENPKQRFLELSAGLGPNRIRVVKAILILLIGIPIAFISKEAIDRIAISGLAIILALQTSGILERFAQWIIQVYYSEARKPWQLSYATIAIPVFMVLSAVNVAMLNDALRNGPLWFRDYGLGGMQYGAFQIFDVIKQYHRENPNTRIIFSPDWANGTDIVARFFLEDSSFIQLGSIRGHITQKLPLDDNTLFIMTPQEYDLIKGSNKFKDITVERIIPYPDRNPGFYFIRLRYVDNIDDIFAAEDAVRQVLQEAILKIDGQWVNVRFTYLDTNLQHKAIELVFDNDPYTVAKTFENNPFVIEITFPQPRVIKGFSIIIGSAKVQITLKCYSTPNVQPTIYTFDGQGTEQQPQLSFELPTPTTVQVLEVDTFEPLATFPAKIHIWELKLR